MSNGTDLEPLALELLGKPREHGLIALRLNPAAERIRPPRRAFWKRAVKKKKAESAPKRFDGPWHLDAPLIEFAKGEFWTIRDSFQGTLVTGRPGSGKTSASGRTLAHAFLKKGYGGLVLCAKNSESDLWRSYLKETGRIDDGVFFGPDQPWRFNFLDHQSRAKGNGLDHLDNLSTLFLDILEVKKESVSGDVDAAFWLPQKKALLRGLFGLILLAKRPLTLGLMNDIMSSSPRDPNEAESRKWRSESLLFRLLSEAEALNGEHPEMAHVSDYWMVHRPGMDSLDKTRKSIDLQIRGLTDSGLSRGKLGELLGTVTNVTPNDCFSGKVIIVDLPVSEYKDEGKYAASILTTAFYRATQRRRYSPAVDRPVFLFADEAQNFSIRRRVRAHDSERPRVPVGLRRRVKSRVTSGRNFRKFEHQVDACQRLPRHGNVGVKDCGSGSG
jgi:hypothetical protein